MDAQEASESIDELVEMIDELPEETIDKAPEFFEDVRSNAVSMQETLNRTGRCSDKQARAIRNWTSSVEKWNHD